MSFVTFIAWCYDNGKINVMVVIRLSRAGAVHRPFYHVVVSDSRSRRDSNYIERLGYLNYFASGQDKPFRLDVERVNHWVSKGAVIRPSVSKLIRRIKRESQQANQEQETQTKATPDGPETSDPEVPTAKSTAAAQPATAPDTS